MPRSSTTAALSATAACSLAGLAFVPAPSTGSIVAARQPVAAAPQAASSTPLQFGAASVAAVGVAAASTAGSSSRRQRRVVVKAEGGSVADAAIMEDEDEGPVVVKTEAPFDPSKQVGATLPLMYWDPAGFCKTGDRETFYNYRCAELKHGRVAMIASLGFVLQHNIKFPGFGDVPAGLGAVITMPGTIGLLVLVGVSGFLETQVWAQDPKVEPGNFGDPLAVGQYYDEWRNRELNNGRMAMIAAMAIMIAELVTGKDGVEQIWTPLSNVPVE